MEKKQENSQENPQEKPKIVQVLDDARLAHRSGDFVNALKFYETFFDHALDDDPYALYGVRLSYCLSGWAKLAEEFAGAKQRLVWKQQDCLQRYHATKSPELFHDYYCISRSLGLQGEALEQFVQLHEMATKSAAKLIKYVWEDLIAAEKWQICNQFLLQATEKLDELFAIFDESVKLQQVDASFANDEFEQHVLGALVAGVQNVVLVLRNNNRQTDTDDVQRQFYANANQRNHSGLNQLVQAKGSFLFSGH